MKQIITLFSIILVLNVAATDYYISNVGSDGAAGTSTGTAWLTINKINISSFNPGDNIYFRRGDTWREQLTIPSSGSSGNLITFGAYGTGARPIISAGNIVTGWTNDGSNRWWVNNPNAVTTRAMAIIGGIVFTEETSVANVNAASEYFIDVSTSPDRLYVYSTVDPATLTAEISTREYCISTALGASSKRFIEIDDIEVRCAGRAGIYFEGPNSTWGSSLDGSSIVRRCFAYANRAFGIVHYDRYNNFLVEDCVASYNGNGFYSWQADGGTFRRDTSFDNIHYEATSLFTDGGGVQCYQGDNWLAEYCVSNRDFDAIHIDAGSQPCHGIMRYNKVYDSRAGSPNTPNMGEGNLTTGGQIDIYYNLLVNGASANMEAYSTNSATVNFWNNTCYLSATTGTDGQLGLYHGSGAANWNIKNNIFAREYVAGEYNVTFGGGTAAALNYNLYIQLNAGGGNALRVALPTLYTTLAAMQAGTTYEDNGLNADPLFVNVASDWSLQSGSPCRNAGVSVGLTQDILGNSIVGNPDIGAYELSAIAGDPPYPAGRKLPVKVQ